jgi:hypothetical protein
MLHHRTTIFALTLLTLVAGCGGGGGGNSTRRSTASGASSIGLSISAVAPVPEARFGADVAVLPLSIAANGVAVEFRGLTVRASGTVDEPTALGALKLVGDDDRNGRYTLGEPVLATVPAPAFVANDGSATLTLTNPIQLAAGATLRLLVTVDATAVGQTALARIGQTVVLNVDAAAAVQASSTPNGPFPISGAVTLQLGDHLLISELVGDPQGSEFIELFNPTARPIDLSNVYITDADDLSTPKTVEYYFLPRGTSYGPSNQVADFLVRFPAGATLAPGQVVTVATEGSGFLAAYGKAADYCTRLPAGGSVQMLTSLAQNGQWTATPTGTSTSFFPSGEPVVVFTWDGTSDLVKDLDALYLGTKAQSGANDPHDKTGVQVDGPDADTTPSVYVADTAAGLQATVAGNIVQRIDFSEGAESLTGGNGVTGNDETSEPMNVTFVTATTATPGTP